MWKAKRRHAFSAIVHALSKWKTIFPYSFSLLQLIKKSDMADVRED
jgi:hypothetical protein